jgi:hypothetical protein
MINQYARGALRALGLKPLARHALHCLHLQPVPSSQISQADRISTERLAEIVKVCFPKADSDYTPSLFCSSERYPVSAAMRGAARRIKNAFLLLHASMKELGYAVNECGPGDADLTVNWSGKDTDFPSREAPLILEHGWIPRASYQLSDQGANALSHVAAAYRFEPLSPERQAIVRDYVRRMRQLYELKTDRELAGRLRESLNGPFILFPFQLSNDFNLRYSNSVFQDCYDPDPQGNLAFAQACVDHVEAAGLPLPVVFKQHPGDTNDLASELIIRDPRNRLISRTDPGGTMELFATGQCKLVVSVNSNTLHEGLLWDVPGIALGTLVWSEETPERPMPRDLSGVDSLLAQGTAMTDVTLSYLEHLIRHQWFLSDFANPLIVQQLVRTRGHCVPLELRRELGLEVPQASSAIQHGAAA